MNSTPVAVTTSLFSASEPSPISSHRYCPATWARLARTTMPARATPQPPSQPAQGPKARRAQMKVVPQSGMALLSSRKA